MSMTQSTRVLTLSGAAMLTDRRHVVMIMTTTTMTMILMTSSLHGSLSHQLHLSTSTALGCGHPSPPPCHLLPPYTLRLELPSVTNRVLLLVHSDCLMRRA